MEQTDRFNNTQSPSYWGSVGIAALIFAIITWAIGLAMGYVRMGGDVGWVSSIVSGVVVCLIGAFAGMMAVWHYSKENDITMKLGKGALIGFLTGVAMVIISIILSKIWLLIDPDYYLQMKEATLANIETMDLPEEQEEAMLNRLNSNFEDQFTIWRQLLWGIPIYGILNLLTGMLGVQLFAKEEEDF